jgi:saccharopine dehydrogenase-like NADP-dependent oxidoreductase
MSKTIAIIGATGTQGSSVARSMLKDKSWKVCAITRNINSDAAKALASSGAEVVAANCDDEHHLFRPLRFVILPSTKGQLFKPVLGSSCHFRSH